MKVIFLLALVCSIFSCGNPDSKEDYVFSTDSIVVYGNLHLVPNEILSAEELQPYLKYISATQHWLHQTVSEEIILLEGFPLDSQITRNYYLSFYRQNFGHEMRASELDSVVKFASIYDVQTTLIFEGKKILFGSEDKELYELICQAVEIQPELNLSPELLDARSIAMARNAKKLSMFYKKKVAIIVGDNHLNWFSENGYPVFHPPDIN